MSGDEQFRPPEIDHYRIERELGRGGMAVVYAAQDLKQNRSVALKLLRPELSRALGARFLREIDITARLDHPYIVPLLDSGHAGGQLFYTMPRVEGESLRDRLRREKQLPIKDALRIARAVADALAYAHSVGVVHRDIKPENILLSGAHARVADFGIAAAITGIAATPLTDTGVVIGTAEYMSPEQAAGEGSLDGRSDIYSLGCVLYEMLAGRPPFTGATRESIARQHLIAPPTAIGALRPAVSEALEAVLSRALEKAAADRFDSAAHLGAALMRPELVVAPSKSRRRAMMLAGLSAAALAAIAGAIAWGARAAAGAGPTTLGSAVQVTAEDGLEILPALSPDGNMLAYASGSSRRMRILLRSVRGGRVIALTDDSAPPNQYHPRWSPDGNHILYLSQAELRVVSALGGASRVVVRARNVGTPRRGGFVSSAAWALGGRELLVVRGNPVSVVALDGGSERRITEAVDFLHSCDWSPRTELIACIFGNFSWTTPGIAFGNLGPTTMVLISRRTGSIDTLTAVGSRPESPRWSPDGAYLYFVSNPHGPHDIYRLRIGENGSVRAPLERLSAGLHAHTIDLSADGRRLAYATYSFRSNLWSLEIPAEGTALLSDARPVTSGSQIIEGSRVTRDGRWLLYDSNVGGSSDIYRVHIAGGSPERLTSDSADEFAPDMSPGGDELVYHSTVTGTRDVFTRVLSDGVTRQLTSSNSFEKSPVWSPDGSAVAYFDDERLNAVNKGLFVMRRNRAGEWSAPIARQVGAGPPEWMPDGKHVIYERGGWLEVIHVDSGPPRRVFQLPPRCGRQVVISQDGRLVYAKCHDPEGRTSFWEFAYPEGQRRLVAFLGDTKRPSNSGFFAVGAGKIFFTIEERQSDIWVAELAQH